MRTRPAPERPPGPGANGRVAPRPSPRSPPGSTGGRIGSAQAAESSPQLRQGNDLGGRHALQRRRRHHGDLGGGGVLHDGAPPAVDDALERESCAPTGYGLGKSGWVTITMGQPDSPNAATLRAWILESYRAIAPKKLAAQLKA